MPVFEDVSSPYSDDLVNGYRTRCEGICTVTLDPADVASRVPPLCIQRFDYNAPSTETELTEIVVVFSTCPPTE
ncbi:hypothetical protein ACI8AA_14265 [Geodermatophilus sp. SYSU D01180]